MSPTTISLGKKVGHIRPTQPKPFRWLELFLVISGLGFFFYWTTRY
jgi:hypothetical protein